MDDPLAGLEDAIGVLHAVWAGEDACGRAGAAGSVSAGRIAVGAAGAAGSRLVPVQGLGRTRLVAVSDALGTVGRHLDAVRAQVAAEIEHESRPELGPASLAKQQGFRNATVMVAATGGISTGDAGRLAKVGKRSNRARR